jgi:thiamine pyrophosphate-dependent acetolactate synthase large subunit-like protein
LSNMAETSAADLLVEELQARGVSFVATLNGHGLVPFYLACSKAGMRMIDVRNEQSASYIAEVTGRLTRSVGVAAVSGAVAHANALSGVLNAWMDGAPMLLITGVIPLAEAGWGGFQDFNPIPMTSPICKFSRLIDIPERVPQLVHEAFMAATSGRPGPVSLALPIDVAAKPVDLTRVPRSAVRAGEVRISGTAPLNLVQEAAKLIKRSKRPVLVAGSGLYYSRGERALADFALQQQIPTVIPIWDRGTIPECTPTFMGVIGAASGASNLLADADLLVLAGAEFDYRVGQISSPALRREAKVIRIHADPGRLRSGLEAHLSIAGSPGEILNRLAHACAEWKYPPATAWLQEAQKRRDEFRQRCAVAAQQLPVGTNGLDVVKAIQDVLTDDTVLLVDGGNIGQWFHQFIDRYPGHWVTCGSSGVVGWGLPGALAASALYPNRPVILLSGDGAFTFTVAELECAARQGLKFVALVADDEQWGISVTGQVRDHGRPLYSLLGPMRLDQVAEGFGCAGMRVERKEDLIPALRSALSATRPTVIQVPIVPGSPS